MLLPSVQLHSVEAVSLAHTKDEDRNIDIVYVSARRRREQGGKNAWILVTSEMPYLYACKGFIGLIPQMYR